MKWMGPATDDACGCLETESRTAWFKLLQFLSCSSMTCRSLNVFTVFSLLSHRQPLDGRHEKFDVHSPSTSSHHTSFVPLSSLLTRIGKATSQLRLSGCCRESTGDAPRSRAWKKKRGLLKVHPRTRSRQGSSLIIRSVITRGKEYSESRFGKQKAVKEG
mmetsp:Transcript_46537/g.91887  ORF Transcript_46537/g.91887 Transcript_46537/m.91887 type:complete len:160 (-) Transcript_46537:813-1292(-)